MAIASLFTPISTADGSWDALIEDWRVQCEQCGEEFEGYAEATLRELEALAADGHPRAGVYALKDGESFVAVCQANCVPLPGYDGPVLRIRFMTVAPKYDFGVYSIHEYATLLISLFVASIGLSVSDRPANHLKFHLRSPADIQFFAALGSELSQRPVFTSVQTRGAWLYVTK